MSWLTPKERTALTCEMYTHTDTYTLCFHGFSFEDGDISNEDAHKHYKKIDARLRRLCEKKPSGKCNVPSVVHELWSKGGTDRDQLRKMFEEFDCEKADMHACMQFCIQQTAFVRSCGAVGSPCRAGHIHPPSHQGHREEEGGNSGCSMWLVYARTDADCVEVEPAPHLNFGCCAEFPLKTCRGQNLFMTMHMPP